MCIEVGLEGQVIVGEGAGGGGGGGGGVVPCGCAKNIKRTRTKSGKFGSGDVESESFSRPCGACVMVWRD